MLKLEFVGTGEIFYATKHSAGFDICSQDELEILPSEYKLLKTGLRIVEHSIAEKAEINGLNYRVVPEIQIRPRSGLAAKQGVAAILGTVDADSRDEIKVLLQNFSNIPFKVNKGDRIAQGVCSFVLQLPDIKVREVERGEGGHGSTGV